MINKHIRVASLGAIIITTAGSSAFARNHHMKIFTPDGTTIFDDGKLDGKGCVVGNVAVFNPATGQITTKPSAKCNF